ncbi:DNA methyltransferase, partial [Paracoccus sp. PXZ]
MIAETQLLEAETTGLLIHSENNQALRALGEKLRNAVDCIYIDPPYNTDASSIVYKNNYKDSSWISLMDTRLSEAQKLMRASAVIAVA